MYLFLYCTDNHSLLKLGTVSPCQEEAVLNAEAQGKQWLEMAFGLNSSSAYCVTLDKFPNLSMPRIPPL